MYIPEKEKEIIRTAQDIIEDCSASLGTRGAAYRNYAQFIETGKVSGGLSLANTLYAHNDRLASHLFCPTDARFSIEFESRHDQKTLKQAEAVARILSRAFGRHNFDLTYSHAVRGALDYGAMIVKLTGKTEMIQSGDRQISHIKEANARVVPPWQIGVIDEGRNGLANQEAIMENVYLSKYDVWRRIQHMADSDKLYRRIISHSDKTHGNALPSAFVQVLSTAVLNISPQGSNPASPGGIIQMSGDPNYATTGPQVTEDKYLMNELWAWDDMIGDYLMIQMIQPDILIAPRYRRVNEFCTECLPYLLVQPNEVPGYFWGRSEIVDLMTLQTALSETMDDFRRIIGVQYDKKIGFEGFDGDPQELYDDLRMNGWVNGRQGAKVNDLTPKLPDGALEYIKLIRTMMEDISGFGNILSGQGQPGVRAGNHAQTLVKTASPRLRDRSLVVERQYAQVGDRYLSYMEAKDATQYATDPEKPEETSFTLAQLPGDRHVMVDSHSSSPIYENDHNQLAAFGLKAGLIDGEDAIDMLNFPNRDEKKRKYREREAAKAKMIQEHPEILAKGRARTR